MLFFHRLVDEVLEIHPLVPIHYPPNLTTGIATQAVIMIGERGITRCSHHLGHRAQSADIPIDALVLLGDVCQVEEPIHFRGSIYVMVHIQVFLASTQEEKQRKYVYE